METTEQPQVKIDKRTTIKLAAKTREIRAAERRGDHAEATELMARLFYYVENTASYYDWDKLR